MKKLFIYTNDTEQSLDAAKNIRKALISNGLEVSDTFTPDADMIMVIGGDGAFLKALEYCSFSSVPMLGVNTGHLGFFQELLPDEIDSIIAFCRDGSYTLQPYRLLEAEIQKGDQTLKSYALNDICLRDCGASVIRIKIEVGNNFVETLYGDGLLVASPAGSTAYNYSLRGAIVDPRLEALQLTALAPINTLAYRSFTSSMLFPPSLAIKASLADKGNLNIGIFADGKKIYAGDFDVMKVSLSERIINVVRGKDYDFWSKVESKLL